MKYYKKIINDLKVKFWEYVSEIITNRELPLEFIKKHYSIETNFDRNFTGGEIDSCIVTVQKHDTTFYTLRYNGLFICLIIKGLSVTDIHQFQAELLHKEYNTN